MDSLVIVDCQYDFIDGSLACSGSHEAVAYLINFINRHEMEVLYTSDWHSPANRSFKGEWRHLADSLCRRGKRFCFGQTFLCGYYRC